MFIGSNQEGNKQVNDEFSFSNSKHKEDYAS